MIYYTGDIHGDVRPLIYFISEQELKSEDIVVILGDVGLNYFGNDYGDRRNKKKLLWMALIRKKLITVLRNGWILSKID